MRSFCKVALLLAALVCATPAQAGVWAEIGDAGETPATAQIITLSLLPGGNPLTAITGEITSGNGFGDVYRFRIDSPTTFSATTVGTGGSLADTQLQLFTTTGMGIAFNDDDAVSGTFRSFLPPGNSLYATLAPGDYLLGISGFNSDPVSSGGAIFPDAFPGVFGPTGPGGGSPLIDYVGGSATGTYRIELTGSAAAVPEPTSLLLAATGLAGALVVRFRRRRQAV